LWNPPVATTTGATPIALLIDDGFGAAASWDARLRTADDIVARAEADNRGVAIVPLGEATRDISLQLPAAAASGSKQLKPLPTAVERSRRAADHLAAARRRPPTWRWSGCPMASISAAARNSSLASRPPHRAAPSPS
jgi:hypothetical protein